MYEIRLAIVSIDFQYRFSNTSTDSHLERSKHLLGLEPVDGLRGEEVAVCPDLEGAVGTIVAEHGAGGGLVVEQGGDQYSEHGAASSLLSCRAQTFTCYYIIYEIRGRVYYFFLNFLPFT